MEALSCLSARSFVDSAMDTLRTITLILHISAAAVLIGVNTGVMRNLRRTLELSQETFILATQDLAHRSQLRSACSGLTLVTGIALIMMMGGMAKVPLNIHIALGLVLLSMIVAIVLMKPASKKINILAKATPLDKSGANALMKRLMMGESVLHVLWLATLTMMIVRIHR